MKKIVIISMATYPSQTPRGFRTHELSTELARLGFKVNLYVLDGGFDYSNYCCANNLSIKSLGKTRLFKYNHEKDVQLNFLGRILKKFFKNIIEFPYIELAFKAFKTLKKEKDIDLLITIGAPHPIHWGAAMYKKIHTERFKNTRWIADCGDPYMGNSFHKKLFYFKYIEKFFFRKADAVTIPLEKARSAYYSEFHSKIHIIPQGFNFDNINIVDKKENNKTITFIYAGIFYPNLRDPRPFLDYLATCNYDFKFFVYTKTKDILKDYEEKLMGKLFINDYIPRSKLIFEMSKADFILNLENITDVQSPSKLIDYALSKTPILSLNTNIPLDISIINEFMEGNYSRKLVINNLEDYNIKNVVKSFLELSTKL